MPFALNTAPSRLNKIVNTDLKNLIHSTDVMAYTDDILVGTSSIKHHFLVLKELLRLLFKEEMKL